jgi:predicted XRE-type DNA-binding protein
MNQEIENKSDIIKEKILMAIEKEMQRRNLSQGDVARSIGLDRRNVNKIFRGTEKGVSIEQLIRIAQGIDLNIDVIIKRSKE